MVALIRVSVEERWLPLADTSLPRCDGCRLAAMMGPVRQQDEGRDGSGWHGLVGIPIVVLVVVVPLLVILLRGSNNSYLVRRLRLVREHFLPVYRYMYATSHLKQVISNFIERKFLTKVFVDV